MKEKIIDWIKKEIGWQNGLFIFIFFLVIAYAINKKIDLRNKSNYVDGISEGIRRGVRGHFYLYYHFNVNGTSYTGSMPNTFCDKCKKCCDSGNVVYVRYEHDNPDNNELVTDNPNN